MNFVSRLAPAAIVLGLLLPLFAPGPAQAAPEGPFESFAGAWTGEGSIDTSGGSTERLRCRSTNAVAGAGDTLNMNLDCKSDAYVFNLRVNATSQSGHLLGAWTETTRGSGRRRGAGGKGPGSGDGARTGVLRGGRDCDARLPAVRDDPLGRPATLVSLDHAASGPLIPRRPSRAQGDRT